MRKLFLPDGDASLIDDNQYDLLKQFKWSITNDGYVISKGCRLHHCIIGFPLHGLVVDHINGDRLDNRRSNLRIVTVKQNNHNRGPNRKSDALGLTPEIVLLKQFICK